MILAERFSVFCERWGLDKSAAIRWKAEAAFARNAAFPLFGEWCLLDGDGDYGLADQSACRCVGSSDGVGESARTLNRGFVGG